MPDRAAPAHPAAEAIAESVVTVIERALAQPRQELVLLRRRIIALELLTEQLEAALADVRHQAEREHPRS
jgi:hypothetical protein